VRIKRIALHNFRSHNDTEVDLTDRVLIVGPNGGGKSSILDAACYALTGVCRGTDAGGKGAGLLASYYWHEKDPGGGVIVEVEHGGALTKVRRDLGQGPKSPVGDELRRSLNFDPDLVQAVFRPDGFLGLPAGAQADLFVSQSQKDEDISEVCARHLKDLVPDERIPSNLRELDLLEKTAREARPDLKKRLAEQEKKSVAGAIPADMRDQPTADLQGALEKLSDEREQLRRQVSTPEPILRPIQARDSVLAEYETAVYDLETAQRMTCPGCKRVVYSTGKSLIAEDALIATLETLRGKIKERQKAAAPQPQLPKAEPVSVQERLGVLERSIGDLDRAIYLRAQERDRLALVEELKGRIKRADDAVKVMAPKGPLRAELAGRPPRTGPDLKSLVIEIMKAAGWGDVALVVDPWTLSEDEVPAHLLSNSQRWRLNFAVQAALAHVSGLRILALDNTEILTPENRARLQEGLLVVMPLIDQVIVCASKDPSDILQAAPPEGWTVLWVERTAHEAGRFYSRVKELTGVPA